MGYNSDTNYNVFVDFFNNKTAEPRLEDYFIKEFKKELIIHPNIKVVFKDQADFVISGEIKDFKKASISYSVDDRTLEYRLFVNVKVIVKDKKGKLINQKNFVWNKEYKSGYTGVKDFDIGASEAKKKEFIIVIFQDISAEIYHWFLSNDF